jgi:hypothetical protein
LCSGNGIPDFSEITKSFTVPAVFKKRYSDYVNRHVEKHSGLFVTEPSFRVTSNGPNSRPKWLTADVEAYGLIKSKLGKEFKILCLNTGNYSLYEYMESRANTLSRVDRQRLRYITTVRDKGNKCRLVAISDYWTQIILEPIMKDVKKYTRDRFKNVSFAHNHSQGFKNLQKHIKLGVKCYDVKS